MITIESTTCYMISGPESFEQGRFLNFVSTVKIQEERTTALAGRESAKLPTNGKTKRSQIWVLFWAEQPII